MSTGLVYYATDSEYGATISSYYAADVQDVKPTCIFKPKTAQDLAKGIKALNSNQSQQWNVAVKGGGHAPYASNNVQDGVTIDLARMNSVVYKSCKKDSKSGHVGIGAGTRWSEVYATLEPQGIMVGGGRESHVGVAGFLLGGGFSWYSGKRGMAIEDVVAYEVVLADGSIVWASGTKNNDLFKALKGGLNNLGIVTKFELKTFPAKNLYGGIIAFAWPSAEGVVTKFVGMIDNNKDHPEETGFLSFAWSPSYPMPMAVWLTANTDGVANSTSFQGLEELGPVMDYRMNMPLTGLTAQMAGTTGLYNVWYTLTIENNMDMARKYMQVYIDMVNSLVGKIDEEISLIFVLSPLPKTYAQHGGGNILGLDKTLTKNSIILQPEVILPTKKYQSLIQGKLREAVATMEAYAKSKNQHNPYLYINYANPEQNPIAAYGSENVQFLAKTAKKYDPSGYFQTRVAGAFKVSAL